MGIQQVCVYQLTCEVCHCIHYVPWTYRGLNTDTREIVRSAGWFCPTNAKVILGFDSIWNTTRIVDVQWKIECPDCHKDADVISIRRQA